MWDRGLHSYAMVEATAVKVVSIWGEFHPTLNS
jgi:hypothetical protein